MDLVCEPVNLVVERRARGGGVTAPRRCAWLEFGGFGRAFGTNVTGMRAPKRAEDWVMIRRLENRVHLQITSTPRRDADSFKLKEICCTVGHACKQHSVPPRSPSVPQSSLGGRNNGKNAGIMVLYLPTCPPTANRLPPTGYRLPALSYPLSGLHKEFRPLQDPTIQSLSRPRAISALQALQLNASPIHERRSRPGMVHAVASAAHPRRGLGSPPGQTRLPSSQK